MVGKMSRKTALAGVAAAGVLGLGIAVPATMAFGHTPTPSGSAAPSDSSEQWQQQREERVNAYAEALAKELGLPTDKVKAALEKVRAERKPADRPDAGTPADRVARLTERLAEAVKEGKLTQEQADAIVTAVEAGVLPGGGWWGHGQRHGW
ncbi:MAG TPA: hypothetical protein VGD43_17470 [Micromonospora sp.]